MKWIYGFISAWLLLCWACGRQAQPGEGVVRIGGYDGEVAVNGEGIVVDSFQVVPLVLTGESAIMTLQKVVVTDSLLLIHSDNHLLVFDKEGHFVRCMGKEGRAPGEYVRLNTFFVNREQGTVGMVDEALGKVLTFSMRGDFLSERKYGKGVFEMLHGASLVQDSVLLCDYYVTQGEFPLYALVNLATGEKRGLLASTVRSDGAAEMVGRTPVAVAGGEAWLLLPFDNRLYVYAAGSVQPACLVEMDKHLLGQKQLEAVRDFSIMACFRADQQGDFGGFRDICLTEDYLFLGEAGAPRYFWVDRAQGLGRLYDYGLEEQVKTLPLLGILGSGSDYFVGALSAFQLKDVAGRIPVDTDDRFLHRLKVAGDSVEWDANPCLLFYFFNK